MSWNNRILGAYAEARRSHVGVIETEFVWKMSHETEVQILAEINSLMVTPIDPDDVRSIYGIRIQYDDDMRPGDLWLQYTVVA